MITMEDGAALASGEQKAGVAAVEATLRTLKDTKWGGGADIVVSSVALGAFLLRRCPGD